MSPATERHEGLFLEVGASIQREFEVTRLYVFQRLKTPLAASKVIRNRPPEISKANRTTINPTGGNQKGETLRSS